MTVCFPEFVREHSILHLVQNLLRRSGLLRSYVFSHIYFHHKIVDNGAYISFYSLLSSLNHDRQMFIKNKVTARAIHAFRCHERYHGDNDKTRNSINVMNRNNLKTRVQ